MSRSFTNGNDNWDTKLLWELVHPPQSGVSHHPRRLFRAHRVWIGFLPGGIGGAAALLQLGPSPGLPATSQPHSLSHAHPGSVEHIFRDCAIRIITRHWGSSHFAFPSPCGRHCLPLGPSCDASRRPPWAHPRPRLARSPSALCPQRRFQGLRYERRHGPTPPSPISSASVSLLGGRRPRPDPGPAAYSPDPSLPPGSGITQRTPRLSCPF